MKAEEDLLRVEGSYELLAASSITSNFSRTLGRTRERDPA
jgi:hypothetical protein